MATNHNDIEAVEEIESDDINDEECDEESSKDEEINTEYNK